MLQGPVRQFALAYVHQGDNVVLIGNPRDDQAKLRFPGGRMRKAEQPLHAVLYFIRNELGVVPEKFPKLRAIVERGRAEIFVFETSELPRILDGRTNPQARHIKIVHRTHLEAALEARDFSLLQRQSC